MSGEVVWLTKLVHIAAISLWSAGLIVLPFLLVQRAPLRGEDLHRLHRLVRFHYVCLVSPAAYVAIGSGTVLIFLQWTFVEWFSAKLAFVGLMTAMHLLIGLAILRVFAPDGRFGRLGSLGITAGNVVAVTGVLWLVLAKPDLDAAGFATGVFAPGALADLMEPLIASVRR